MGPLMTIHEPVLDHDTFVSQDRHPSLTSPGPSKPDEQHSDHVII